MHVLFRHANIFVLLFYSLKIFEFFHDKDIIELNKELISKSPSTYPRKIQERYRKEALCNLISNNLNTVKCEQSLYKHARYGYDNSRNIHQKFFCHQVGTSWFKLEVRLSVSVYLVNL